MTKLLCALLSLCLLLGACASAPAEGTLMPVQTAASGSGALVFLADSEDDPLYSEAVALLARKASELTDGALRIEVQPSTDPARDFALGNGDLLFIDGRADSAFSESLSFLSEPMRYNDYLSLTMALNSERMLELLSDELKQDHGLLPLAAFYQGSDFLLAARQSGGDIELLSAEGGEDGAAAQTPVAVLREESRMRDILARHGMEVRAESSASGRLSGVSSGDIALAEFTSAELDGLEWDEPEQLTLVRACHNTSPRWLLMGTEAREGLSERHFAALQEAVCYLFPVIDDGFRQRENDVIALCRKAGISVKYSFPSLWETAGAFWDEYAASSPKRKYMLGILNDME